MCIDLKNEMQETQRVAWGAAAALRTKVGEIRIEQMNSEVENSHMHILKCFGHDLLRNLGVL